VKMTMIGTFVVGVLLIILLVFEGRHLADIADWIAMSSALLAAVGLACAAYLEAQASPKGTEGGARY
jgi:hypothetical protein